MIEDFSAAVERLFETDIDGMVDAAVRADYLELRCAADRIESRAASLLAAIHHRGIPFENGASSTPAWVQYNTGQRKGEAHASLEAGLACESLPLTVKAWAQGEISASAARAICEGRPKGHEAAYREIEETLVGYAADRNWRALRKLISHCRRCADALDDREPADRNGLHLSKTTDRWIVNGDFDDLGGDTINTAINAEMGAPIPDDQRSLSKRKADALVAICRHYLDHADLPMEGGETPHISIAIPWDTIHGGITTATGPNLFGPSLNPTQLAELLCDSKIGRIVFGSDSLPLDVGREHRTAPHHIRRAIIARDQGCRFPGCDRTPR